MDGAANNVDDKKYLYGDEGHDSIWGSTNTAEQYIWGGSGDDFIQSGRFVETSILNGGDGDDIINPGRNGNTFNDGVIDVIRGGKGEDILNFSDYVFNEDGTIDTGASDRGGRSNTNIEWDGGEGDDVIWGGWDRVGDALYLGGNGDDTFYANY